MPSYSSEELRKLIVERESAMRRPGAALFSQSRYEIVRLLGEGGMGITCLANEYSAANLKRPVVLKFVKDSLDPQRLTQFLNEVQLSILFNHPNLVPFYRLEAETVTIQPQDGNKGRLITRRPHQHTIHYAVMQYIDGWNLRQVVQRLRNLKLALNYDLAMFLIVRVARGLHYVHEYCDEDGHHLGLVHRDVSPENILIDRFARIKVSDFGIARAMNRPVTDGLQRAGNRLYCSPEQLQGKKLDRSTDIYNIGLLMYLMFTGVDWLAPEAHMQQASDRLIAKMSKSPRDDLEGVDSFFADICTRCLAVDPDDRYQTCETLANDIDIYFKKSQKMVTNEQLEEMLDDLFSSEPTFVSRRFIPLTGSDVLEQPEFREDLAEREPEQAGKKSKTVPMESED